MRAKLLRIAKLERRIAALQADQAELTASFVDERLRFDEDHGYPSDPAQYRAMVAEVAIAKRVSVITAGTFMDDPWGLVHHNPWTLTALRTGRLGLSAARAIARETSVLSDHETRSLADRVLAEAGRTCCRPRSGHWPSGWSTRSTRTPRHAAGSGKKPIDTCR